MPTDNNVPTPSTGFTAPKGRSYWSEYSKYPSEDWKFEVVNGYTRRSYWEWVQDKIEAEDDS